MTELKKFIKEVDVPCPEYIIADGSIRRVYVEDDSGAAFEKSQKRRSGDDENKRIYGSGLPVNNFSESQYPDGLKVRLT